MEGYDLSLIVEGCLTGAAIGLGLINAITFAINAASDAPEKARLPEYRSRIKKQYGSAVYYATAPSRELFYLLKSR